MDDTVTREFEKAWNILKQGQPSQRATDAMAMFQQVQDAKRQRMAMNPQQQNPMGQQPMPQPAAQQQQQQVQQQNPQQQQRCPTCGR